MQVERSHRGWVAATTVALTLTLVFSAVEKHRREEGFDFHRLPQASFHAGSTTQSRGILLTLDPGIAVVEAFPAPQRAVIQRPETGTVETLEGEGIVGLLRRPFEPAAQVVLRAPTSSETDALPLHVGSDDTGYLVEALTRAFESPMRQVSVARPIESDDTEVAEQVTAARSSLAANEHSNYFLPEPRALFAELSGLDAPTSLLVSQRDIFEIQNWAINVREQVGEIVSNFGRSPEFVDRQFHRLHELAQQATEYAGRQEDYTYASRLLRTVYSLERRLAIWEAISSCMATAPSDLRGPTPISIHDVKLAIAHVLDDAIKTGDPEGWKKFLLLDDLTTWASHENVDWEAGHRLAIKITSRMKWQRMTDAQREFINGEAPKRLSAVISPWTVRPVDYRKLLNDLETLEEDPTHRCRTSLASAVQTLSLSSQPAQLAVASTVNDHYRNANIRLTVAGSLLDRMLPNTDWEKRPVRQRVLGADTRGSSQYKTQLRIQLIPDDAAWHVKLGVNGDLHSSTQASKDPAIVHTSSVAQISTGRTVRMDPFGYKISGTETNVQSQQVLRGFSTQYDSLPIIGEFVRVLVREKFNEQRPIAQRIVNGIIARETDQELDKQLNAALVKAEKEISERLIGPLESLNLDPMVASMNTTSDRLSVRYRVASHGQMAAHSARPRAPSDSLMSVQVHESAINNTIAQLGLEGRTWTLAELAERMAKVLRQDQWKLSPDVPNDITIRFADSRPITVRMMDGRLELTLRIAELSQPGRMHYERFIVKTRYVPAANGLYAALVRDEEDCISVDGPRLRAMQTIAIRAIFAKIFVGRSTFPLLSPQWQEDPRAQGMAVSQVEVRDGWLALAVSHEQSPHAARTAAAARQLMIR